MKTIFHITTQTQWSAAEDAGDYRAESLQSEGFIHLSRPHQVLPVADALFAGAADLVLLQIDEDAVTAPLKYEGAGQNQFPHIYGPLNLNAVLAVHDFFRIQDRFVLPEPLNLVGDTLIRPGRIGDEAELASCHTHSWQQSYQGLVPGDYLDRMPLAFHRRLRAWRDVVAGRAEESVCVAESAAHGIIGFCSHFGPARGDEPMSRGEIGGLYCLNEYKGKGIGAALLRCGLRELKDSGFDSACLWVLKDNPTVEFYRRLGGVEREQTKIMSIGGRDLEVASYQWDFR